MTEWQTEVLILKVTFPMGVSLNIPSFLDEQPQLLHEDVATIRKIALVQVQVAKTTESYSAIFL